MVSTATRRFESSENFPPSDFAILSSRFPGMFMTFRRKDARPSVTSLAREEGEPGRDISQFEMFSLP